MALLLIQGDLRAFDPAWKGWRVQSGDLISPEGWRIGVGEVLSMPIVRQELAAYKVELKRLREEILLTHEQPLPAEWPEWVFEKMA